MKKLFGYKLATNLIVLMILITYAVCTMANFVSTKFSGVVYASTGIPVNNAMVIAQGPNGYGSAITNSLGQYSINEGLPTGTYTVTVIAQGYLTAEKENVQVVTGQETSNINFYLNASGGISGRVTDAVSGAPLKNIIVTAFPSSGNEKYGWTAITDANGNYSIITNLATGTYNVSVLFPEGYIPKSIEGITVTAGHEVKGINFALERSGIISGKVTADPSGIPLGNATVIATSEDGEYFGYTQTNVTGHYRISTGLGTETYTVMAIWKTNYGIAMDISVTVGAETSNVDITIAVSPPPPSGIITGKVTDKSGNPIEKATVTASGPSGHGTATTDENGNYVISNGLGTGTYTVTASATGYTHEEITNVSVTVNQITPNINFQLTPIPPAQSGKISGTVHGDEDIIPEFQNPQAILLATAAITIILSKIINKKTKRFQKQIQHNKRHYGLESPLYILSISTYQAERT